jgi:hypothetical protein
VTGPRISRSVRCWNDLERFGIVALTGEACGLSMRILCDVTARGKELVERFLAVNVRGDSNWNGGGGEPHVASVLLPHSILGELGAFALVMTGSGAVAALEDGAAVEFEDTPNAEWERIYGVRRYYRRSTAPGTGDRNEHQASGRTT